AVVQLGLLGAAQLDIKRRTADQLNGPRWLWASVSLINFVGPMAYFLFGRRNPAATAVGAAAGR
ncbi:PLDc N-terminal domain-containing protein, partial [Pseudomonas aeruginosa]|uniref:PLDc N-terminal domain-containing protein n=1 Tax=Pseudomonas aeruginosa TaxID=287 RepID=UPI002F90E523